MEPDNPSNAHIGNPSASGIRRPQPAGNTTRTQYLRHLRRKWLVIAVALAAVCALVVASVTAGSASLSVSDVLLALVGQGGPYNVIVVWNLRMPRILTALVGGVALALAGCAFQSVLRNPLASASTLGIAQGAAFGASIAIVVLSAWGTSALGGGAADALGGAGGTAIASAGAYEGIVSVNPYATAACAFLGAIASTLVILGLSRFRDMTPESIVLAGVALSALFSGATALIQYFAEDTQVAAVVFWTFGDLGRVGYRELAVMAAVTAAAGVFFALNRWNFNAMESGEGSAHGLGVSVNRVRLSSMFAGALASSVVIAFCGTINFIGLVAPHIMRRFLGSDYRFLLPGSAIAGAGILLASDLIARMAVESAVLPISAITSFVGAPLFLYLLLKGARR